jgi:hypothetical protein
MALPSTISTVEVTAGPFMDHSGRILTGYIVVTPSVSTIVHAATGTPLMALPITLELFQGRASLRLPATDQTGFFLNGAPVRNWTYLISVVLEGETVKTLDVSLPALTLSVDLDSLLPAGLTASDVAIARLDNRAPEPIVFGGAFDSTGDEADEIITAGLDQALVRWPERSAAELAWEKVADKYGAQFTLQNGIGGGTPSTVPLGTAPVVTTQNVTIFQDDFNRTVAELVGSPAGPIGLVNSPWQGVAGQYRVEAANGGRIAPIVTTTNPVRSLASRTTPVWAPTRTDARDRADGTWRFNARVSPKTIGSVPFGTDFYGPSCPNGDTIWMALDYNGVSATAVVKVRVGGVTRTVLTMPQEALLPSVADQSAQYILTLSGVQVTAQIIPNGGSAFTVQDSLTPDEVTALSKHDRVMLGSDDPRFIVDQVFVPVRQSSTSPAPVQTIVPGIGLQTYVYNGAIAGSTLRDQIDRFDRMYPLPMDFFVIGGSLNYSNRPPADLIADVTELVGKAKAKNPNVLPIVVMQSPLYTDPSRPASRLTDHENRTRAVGAFARSQGWMVVNAFDAFLAQPDGGRSMMDALGGHPNGTGRALMASLLRDSLWAPSQRALA